MRTFRKCVSVLAMGAFIALTAASIGPSSAGVCSHIENDDDRRQCLHEETDRLIFEMSVHVCARELTKHALATLGLEMGFTARTTPAQIVTAFTAHPERQAQRLNRALLKSSEMFGEIIYHLVVAEDEREREILTICAEKMSDQDMGALAEERLKPPPPEPVDLDWLDDVMAGLE